MKYVHFSITRAAYFIYIFNLFIRKELANPEVKELRKDQNKAAKEDVAVLHEVSPGVLNSGMKINANDVQPTCAKYSPSL